MTDHLPKVGAPDPELNTSPIFDEYEEISLDLELEAGVCYFNNRAYAWANISSAAVNSCIARRGACGYARDSSGQRRSSSE